jgi:hypothetical protein
MLAWGNVLATETGEEKTSENSDICESWYAPAALLEGS